MELLALALVQSAYVAVAYYCVSALIGRSGYFREISPLLAFVPLGVAGLIVFWMSYFIPPVATYAHYVMWAATALLVLAAFRRPIDSDAAIAATLWFVASVALVMWAFWPTGTQSMLAVARTRFSHPLPGDNAIPWDFARGLLAGHVPSPLHADWLSSDRPPLQTGMFLAFRMPFSGMAREPVYQVLSTCLQMMVVPASYLFVRTFEAPRRIALLAAGLVFFAPLTIIHGTFVWPKLLAAAFLMIAAALHFGPAFKAYNGSPLYGLAVGAASAAAALAHGGAVFSLVAFGIVALAMRRFGSLRYVFAAAIAVIALYGPWMGYQRIVDPPGDRLLKMHFADVRDVNDHRGLLETIYDRYSTSSVGEQLGRFQTKIGVMLRDSAAIVSGKPAEDVRHAMFFRPIPSLGAAALGLIALLALPFMGLGSLSAIFVVNLAFWTASMYPLSGVIVHQSSLFMLLLLPLVLAIALRRRATILSFILGAQVMIALIYLPVTSGAG